LTGQRTRIEFRTKPEDVLEALPADLRALFTLTPGVLASITTQYDWAEWNPDTAAARDECAGVPAPTGWDVNLEKEIRTLAQSETITECKLVPGFIEPPEPKPSLVRWYHLIHGSPSVCAPGTSVLVGVTPSATPNWFVEVPVYE
jgi:hypothetical protein